MDEYKCTLSEEAQKYAVEVLHETEEERREKISSIQRWIKTQTELNARPDTKSVIRFLRCCSYDLEETKKRLTNFYKIRAQTPEWFENRDTELRVIQELLDIGVFLPLRQRDSSGRLVLMVRAVAHDPRKYSLNDMFKLSNMIIDIVIEEEEDHSVLGCVAVIDLAGVSLGHTFQLTPTFIGKAVEFWEKCTPLRIRRLDFVNAPNYVNVVLDIFRRCMSPSFQSMIFVHNGKLETLHTVYPQSILPQEYGGSDGTTRDITDFWRLKLKEHREWLLEDEKYKASLSQKASGSRLWKTFSRTRP